MTDMTAEERAEITLKNLIYLDKADKLTKIADQIRQAEAAARLEALKECWHLANTDWDAEWVAKRIRELMDKSDVL